MAFIKPEEFSTSGFPFIPRFGSSTSLYQQHQHHQDKLIPSPTSSTLPLPSMNTFSSSSLLSPQSSSNKRRHHSENISYDLPLPPLKVPKLIPTGDAATIPPPPPLVQLSRGDGGAHHQCTSEDCHYCSGLTNLDIAAFYWSMIAMRGYSKAKTSSVSSTGSSSAYDALPFAPKPLPPSPTASQSNAFDLMTSYNKPPSPSGSLSSMDSEPLSPSCSSTTSESSSTKDLGVGNGVKYQCQVCHKSYSHPRLLNRHLQSHTPYKKHHCPRCRKGFNDAFDLKRHIRTHTGIKPFHCELCEKSFTQVSYTFHFIHFEFYSFFNVTLLRYI